MKKTILALGAMVMTFGAFAQGYISWGQNASLLYSTNFSESTQLGGPGGGTSIAPASPPNTTMYLFALLVQPYNGTITTDTNVWDGSWTFTGLMTTNNLVSGAPGRIATHNDAQVQNWGVGVTNQFIIAGWSVSMGPDWLTVSNVLAVGGTPSIDGFVDYNAGGFFGVSSVGFMAATDSAGPWPAIWSTAGPGPFGTPIGSGFTLYTVPVPEPETILLAGAGGLSLWLFRRRR